MPKTKYIGSPQSRVKNEPVVPGRIILTHDGRQYWDTPEGERIEITDIIELVSEASRKAITSPLEKFYYVLSTDKLWRYNGKWNCINPDYDFIGPDGKILIEYLPGTGSSGGDLPGTPGGPGAPGIPGNPGDVVILGPGGLIPEGYLPLATTTVKGIATLGSTGGAARYGVAADAGLSNVTNDKQVKVTDIQTVEPNASSLDSQVTSSKRLWTMLGGALSTLKTGKKTIVESVNELWDDKQVNIPASTSGHLTTHSGTLGTFGTPKLMTDFIASPPAQTANSQVLIAPATKGNAPSLKPLSDFVLSSGGSGLSAYATNTVPKAHGVATVGAETTYARGDHVHPSEAVPYESILTNIKMSGVQSLGTRDTVARGDHVHPVDTSRASTAIATQAANGLLSSTDKQKLDNITSGANPSSTAPRVASVAAVGSEVAYSRGDHVHPAQVVPLAGDAVPKGLETTGAPGTSIAFSREDHVHPSQVVPTPYTGTPANLGTAATGSSANYSRGDHVHKNPYTMTLVGTTLTITAN